MDIIGCEQKLTIDFQAFWLRNDEFPVLAVLEIVDEEMRQALIDQ